MSRKQLTQWQILVIEQLINRAYEHELHKYDEKSLKTLKEVWSKTAKASVILKD